MTAEIALLNKHGIALAADSAVTVTTIRGQKVYNAGNKLFTLSKRHPVGVMVYGNAEYMSIPWETIIKIYRERLGDRCFDRVSDYFDDFLRFLGSDDELFGGEAQDEYVAERVMAEYWHIRQAIREKWKAHISVNGELEDRTARKLAGEIIRERHKHLAGRGYAEGLDEEFEQQIGERYAPLVDAAKNDVFQKLQVTKGARALLSKIAVAALARDQFPIGTSGVVVAGFGRRDYYPALCTATLEARIAGRLRYRQEPGKSHTVGRGDDSAAIIAFAQIDAVTAFIEGVDPGYAKSFNQLVVGALNELPRRIIEPATTVDEATKANILAQWRGVADQLFKDILAEANKLRRERYVLPLVGAIEALPKEDLAAVAESLVSITSLKRKVSMEVETVGGPIDVAVISRGDGFVWIRRKHYFRPELNQHFTHNYFLPTGQPNGNGGT
jgi:hypothetical protein